METIDHNRREIVLTSVAGLVLASCPNLGFAQTPVKRMEWHQFKNTAQYASFLYAVRTMKGRTDATKPSSWQYWVNVHLNHCPHDVSYFMAWHRGFLYYLERQLRAVSGNSSLTLPYWDYYRYPRIPSEFTDPATGNPLYVPRAGTNVYNALDLSPFSPTVQDFQRGRPNAFEPQFESAPHNPVHNLIGGAMADMSSPIDPIFFLHHANVDRLWHAWSLPDGKGTPYTANPYSSTNSDPYWAGSFTYASGLTLAKYYTYHPGRLGYTYADLSVPTALPPQVHASPILRVQAQPGPTLRRPPRGDFANSPARIVGTDRRSLGGVKGITLDERSVSADVPVHPQDSRLMQDAVTASGGGAKAAGQTYRSVKLVLEDVKLTNAGRNGGWFYNVYVNLPASEDAMANRQRYFVGTLGPVEFATATHHGSTTLEYPATQAMMHLNPATVNSISVSLVRVNGDNAPRGPVFTIGEMRVELSTDAPFDPPPSVPTSSKDCYCE